MSAPRHAARTAIGLAALLLLGFQVYTLGLQPIGAVSNPPTQPLVRIELPTGGLVSQDFVVLANGFSGVTVFPAVGPAPVTDGEVTLEVQALPEDFPRVTTPVVSVARAVVSARELVAKDTFEWRFETIASSRGRAYRLDLALSVTSASSNGPDAHVPSAATTSAGPVAPALWSTLDDRHKPGTLSVNGVQRWGDLAFSLTTSAPTAAGHAVANFSKMVAGGAGPLLWIGLLVLNLLLLAVWRQTIATATAVSDVDPGFADEGPRVQWEAIEARDSVDAEGAHGPGTPRWLVPPMDAFTVVIALFVVAALAGLARSLSSRVDRPEAGAIDLLAEFPRAATRTTAGALHDAFALEDVTIDGVRRASLLALPFSRVTWTVDVPPDAVLRAAIAFRPDAWTREGDGAMFRIGVAYQDRYDERYRRYLAPYASTADRRWFDVEVDLSAYAGARVNLILNTEPGELGNAVSDATVWGAPRIVAHASRSRSESGQASQSSQRDQTR